MKVYHKSATRLRIYRSWCDCRCLCCGAARPVPCLIAPIHDVRAPLARDLAARFGGQVADTLETRLADPRLAAASILAFDDVAAAVLHESPIPILGEAGLNASRMLHAVYDAAQPDQRVAVAAQFAPVADQGTSWTSV